MTFNQDLQHKWGPHLLENLSANGRVKQIPSPSLTSLSSNDYLGFSKHTYLIAAAIKALQQFGTGATGSRYLSGNNPLNEELEDRIAKFKAGDSGFGRIFSSGYHANLSIMSIFGEYADSIYSDSDNHASVIDGLRLLKKSIHIYPHRDWAWIENHLRQSTPSRFMIVTESLFSMGGDIAPLSELYRIVQKNGGLLVIDDSHGTGTIGDSGRGGLEAFGIRFDPNHMIVTGTFSKALGSLGGFAILNEHYRTLLSSVARPFIYTTALPPTVLAASIASIDLLEKSPEYPQQLQKLSLNWQSLLLNSHSTSPIINLQWPLSDLNNTSNAFKDFGYSLPVLRYPTVPRGKECLRLSINLTWTQKTEKILKDIFI